MNVLRGRGGGGRRGRRGSGGTIQMQIVATLTAKSIQKRERERAAHPGQFLDVNLTSKRGKNKEIKGRASQKGFVNFLCLNFIRRFCTMKL